MNTLRTSLLLCAVMTVFSMQSDAQSLASVSRTAYRSAKTATATAPTPNRYSKKLPALYQGYAIEVKTSTYPLDRNNQIFRKFGNIHYDKLERGSYSYLIVGRFSDDESVLHFLHNIIAPQVKDAKAVHYEDGIRRVVRVEQ